MKYTHKTKHKIILLIDTLLLFAVLLTLIYIAKDSSSNLQTHNSTEDRYIQKFISDDPNVFSHIKDKFSDTIKRLGINGSIKLVHEAFRKNTISLSQCHILLHLVGHQAYTFYNGDINQMVGDFGTICWESYQHGVEASIALYDPNYVRDLEKLCKKWQQVYPGVGCYHGVGHAFLETSPKNITLALSKCDSLISTYKDSIPNCYRGAFSELGNRVLNYDGNSGTHYEGTSTVDFNYEHPLVFCQELNERYRESCYSQLTKIIYQAEIGNSINNCNIEQYFGETKLICMRTLGLLYAEDNLAKTNSIKAPVELSSLPDEQRELFISSAISVFNLYAKEATKKDALPFCNSLLLDEDKSFCKSLYKET